MNNIKQFSTIVAVILGILLIAVIISKNSKSTIPENSTLENTYEEPYSNTPYVIEGYYEAQEIRITYDEIFYGTTTCDTFIVTKEDNSLVDKMLMLVKNKNTVNKITNEDKLQINIEIESIDKNTKEKILLSSKDNPVQITVIEKEPEGKGAPTCFSFVNILEAK